MPESCCAIDCTNRRQKSGQNTFHFYRIPTGNTPLKAEKRRQWINAISRVDADTGKKWPETEKQLKYAVLCSAHFITGKSSDDPQNPDFAPSLFTFKESKDTAEKQKLSRYERAVKRRESVEPSHEAEQVSNDDTSVIEQEVAEVLVQMHVDEEVDNCENDAGNNQQCDSCEELRLENRALSEEVTNLRRELREAQAENEKRKGQVFSYNNIKNNEKKMKFYTGFRSTELFMWLLLLCQRAMKWAKVKNTSCTWADQLLMILMKMRLGLKDKDTAYRYGIHETTVSKIMRAWIPSVAAVLRELIVWPSRVAVRQHLPRCFKKSFNQTVGIIDCTEIFIERPLNLTARSETYSNYKNHNTIKYFVCITPSGAISFLSPGWGGRVSDKELTLKCGFLDKLDHGDHVLADRGFNVKDEVAMKGCRLRIPAYTRGKKNLSKEEVDVSRKLSRARIHVERVIGRMKHFHILQTIIPITQVDMLDDIVTICAGLTNLNPSVVPMDR